MTNHHHLPEGLVELTAMLSEYSPLCDPEFDNDLEELERQFAELRLTLNRDNSERTNA